VPASDLASTLGTVSPALAAAFAEWEAARAQDHEAGNAYGRSDDEADSIRADHCAAAHRTKSEALLALGAHSFADLALLLPVVMEWNSPMHVTSSDYPDCLLKEGGEDEGEGLEERSVAYFIWAVMDLLRKQGVQFEPGCRPKLVRDI
jgi:hypothetical protein